MAQAGWVMDRTGRLSSGTAGEDYCQKEAIGDYGGMMAKDSGRGCGLGLYGGNIL
jgi:hypothetical protein